MLLIGLTWGTGCGRGTRRWRRALCRGNQRASEKRSDQETQIKEQTLPPIIKIFSAYVCFFLS